MGLSESFLWDAVIPFAAMVALQVGAVVLDTISKAAMTSGMNQYVLVVYYNALGTLILLPSLLFRKRPPLTFSLLCKFFLLGLIGIAAFIFGTTGLGYSSPTLSSALSNLMPAFTFIFAICIGMEKLDIRKRSSRAKTLGTIASIAGALIITLYKGIPIILSHSAQENVLVSPKSNWVIGGFFISSEWLLFSVRNIFQAAVAREYPEELTISFFCCFFGTFQSAIFTLVAERDHFSVWRLMHRIEWIAVVYSAIVVPVFSTIVCTWCLRVKGPIYVSIFSPFGIVVAVVMSAIFLGDTLYIGSVIGSIIVTIGFLGVLLGNSKEEKEEAIEGCDITTSDSSPTTPLLNHIEDDNLQGVKFVYKCYFGGVVAGTSRPCCLT